MDYLPEVVEEKEEEGEGFLYGFKFRDRDKRRKRHHGEGCAEPFDIKQLWQRSHEILNLALLGHKQSDIAKMLNITQATVSNTLNSTLGKEALADRREVRDEKFDALHDRVMELTEKSLDVYDRILSADTSPDCENFDPEVSLKMQKAAADTVTLELSGLKAPTKVDTRSMHMTLGPDELNDLKQRGFEAARASGKLVEVEDES